MYIAVEGCCHGELNKIYETLQYIEAKEKIEIGLLLCCGDFQAVRNELDLKCMACPDKHKAMQDFWEYYSGDKIAPYLTIFIGGNHEASNYLQELPYGGWVAPKIYYMGYAGVVNYKGLRIGGLSGIFKQHDYAKGHYEKPPYSQQSMRSVYHIRQLEVFKLKQLKQPVDIMMSHDWPNGVVEYGDKADLLSKKKHFAEDVHNHQLGSLPAWSVLTALRPRYWFSGHLHVKFAALIQHEEEENSKDVTENKKNITRFLALDKCLPKRDFVQVLDIECSDNTTDELFYDAEWLAVLKSTNEHLSTSYYSVLLPTKGLSEKWDYSVDKKQIEEVLATFNEDLKIPLNFHRDDSCVYNPDQAPTRRRVECKINPQTTEFCTKLSINDPVMMILNSDEGIDSSFNTSSWISDDGDELPSTIVSNLSVNPDEIELDEDSDSDVPISSEDQLDSEQDSTPDEKQDFNNGVVDEAERRISSKMAANFSMNLPAPVSSTPEPHKGGLGIDAALPVPSFPNVEELDARSLPEEALKSTDIETENKEKPPVTKKFKRRNASMYVSNLEEDIS